MNEIYDIKKQFPFFTTHPDLHYLDSTASSQTPQVVLDAMNEYYTGYRSNIHRGMYDIAVKADEACANARHEAAKFINCAPEEIVFTSGTTHGLNLLARALTKNLKKGDNVVLTRIEHHANLVPWQQMAFEKGFVVRYIELKMGYTVDTETAKKVIDQNTKIVSFTAASNVLGTVTPMQQLIELAKKVDAVTVIDGAQASAHIPLDVQALDCDFLCFSGHKTYGPTGVGVMYGKKILLDRLEPVYWGGDMINEVTYESSNWNEAPYKFEAGTPPIAEIIGLGTALRFVRKTGWENIVRHEQQLTEYLLSKLSEHAKIIGPMDVTKRVGTVSFIIPGVHPHDIAEILNRHNVAVRVGNHCAQPLHKHLSLTSTARASIGIYNTRDDVNELIEGILEVRKLFKV